METGLKKLLILILIAVIAVGVLVWNSVGTVKSLENDLAFYRTLSVEYEKILVTIEQSIDSKSTVYTFLNTKMLDANGKAVAAREGTYIDTVTVLVKKPDTTAAGK